MVFLLKFKYIFASLKISQDTILFWRVSY